MISDMVLLKELHLPDAVVDVLDTYGSCITRAIMKEEYINTIRDAGFINVKIIDEVRSPFNFGADDPNVKEIIKNMDLKLEDITRTKEDNEDSIASIKVYGEKPLK